MNRNRILLFTSCLLFVGLANAQIKSALFLGNSYTNVNNLPQLVSDIASSKGDSLFYDSNTPGGYTLQGHSTNTTSINKIRSKKWNYVILQEQSQRPSFPPSQVQTDVFPYAETLDDLITLNDSCSETMFYMTWGRKYGDQQNCASYPPLCTYAGMQQRLRESYVQMANDNDASVAPVGIAWKNSIKNDSNLNLYSADNSHPSIYGSYLTACVFYVSMFHKSSLGAYYPSSVPAGTAFVLQNIADVTVFDSLSTWRIDTNTSIQSNFGYVQNGHTFNFTDSSGVIGADYFWDFGDGSTSQLQNPTHTYPGVGNYQVSLTVSLNCEQDVKSENIVISLTGLQEEVTQTDLKIFPNPTNGQITIDFQSTEDKIDVQLFNLLGLEIKNWSFEESSKIDLNIEAPKGVYIIRVNTRSSESLFRIIKEQ